MPLSQPLQARSAEVVSGDGQMTTNWHGIGEAALHGWLTDTEQWQRVLDCKEKMDGAYVVWSAAVDQGASDDDLAPLEEEYHRRQKAWKMQNNHYHYR